MPEGNFDNAVNIRGDVPALNLIDTILPGTKSLKIDVNNDMAQIRDLAGGANSLITLDLLNNRVGIKKSPSAKELEINGAVDISSIAPSLTLTDTDPGAKSLRIDVDANIAQIREKDVGNPLLSLNLVKNQLVVFDSPVLWVDNAQLMVTKEIVTQDPPFSCFVLARLKQDRPAPPSGGQSVYTALGCGTDVFTQTLTAADKIVGLEASCAAAQGSATFGNAIRAYCTATGNPNTQLTHSHIINIPPSNVPDNVLPNPPIPKINTIPNSIAVRIAKQFEVTPPRTRDYGIYYGSHAEGSEPTGTFAIYAETDNCFFGGNVGIGIVPAVPSISEQKIRVIGSNSPDNAIFFGVAGNNMSTFLDCWAKDINGVDVRARFGASRSGAGSINVVTNHSIDFSTNNIHRMRISADGNLGLGAAPAFGGGVGVIGIQNATTIPTINPSVGGVLYVQAGALKYRGSAGTITTIAPA